MRLRCVYLWRHGRLPNLDAPLRFTEWCQWQKLNDRSLARAMLTDKLHAKDHASACAGREIAVPTLWSGSVLPPQPPAPLPLVVKANHGCNQYQVVRSAGDWQRARRRSVRWLRADYGEWLDERAYRSARRLLLVEPFLPGEGAPLPVDFKIYVFGGRAEMIQIHEARATRKRWTQFDRNWKRVGGVHSDAEPPSTLAAMFDAAEACARGSDFLRVDFYEVGGRLWFGEYCLNPGSGLHPFKPDSLDLELGRLWSDARN
ncbi:MAG: ATP-grasp fold amidoligase family protein [Sphingomicrobium sp.]